MKTDLLRLRRRFFEAFPEGYAALPAQWALRDRPARLSLGLLADRVWLSPGFLRETPLPWQLYRLAHLAGHRLLGHRPWLAVRDPARQVAEDMAVALLLESLDWRPPTEMSLLPPPAWRGLPVSTLARRLPPSRIDAYPLLDTHALDADAADHAGRDESPAAGQAVKPDDKPARSEGEEPAEASIEPGERAELVGRRIAGRGGVLAWRPAARRGGLPWWHWLSRWLHHRARRDYRFDRPSRREMPPFILPSLGGREARLMVAVDISGSIPPPVVRRFLDEVESLRRQVPVTLRLILADNRLHLDRVIPHGEPLRLPAFAGGGGTDFRPVLERFARDPGWELLIYLTDLRGEFPARSPDRPVLWVRIASDITPPFGTLRDWHASDKGRGAA